MQQSHRVDCGLYVLLCKWHYTQFTAWLEHPDWTTSLKKIHFSWISKTTRMWFKFPWGFYSRPDTSDLIPNWIHKKSDLSWYYSSHNSKNRAGPWSNSCFFVSPYKTRCWVQFLCYYNTSHQYDILKHFFMYIINHRFCSRKG